METLNQILLKRRFFLRMEIKPKLLDDVSITSNMICGLKCDKDGAMGGALSSRSLAFENKAIALIPPSQCS